MINFSVIRYKNFLSSGNSFTEIILNRSKSTLIVGENGAGKSTILDALSFALYGKPFRRINKPQLLNSINQKNLEVEVEFKIGKNEYKIIRGMKPNKFVILKNNKEIDQDASVRDYQDFLEKNILKLNHKSFSQIVVLGSSTFVPFMQLPAQHRREVIEDLLDIQIFSTMNTLLKEKQSINKTDLLDVDYKIQLTEEKIEMQWNHIKELQKNNEKIINEYSTKISNSQIQRRKLQEQNIKLQEEIESWSQDVLELDALTSKKSKMQELEYKINHKISNLKKDIDFYQDHNNCPTCKQDIDENFKDHVLSNKESHVNQASLGIEKLKKEFDLVNNKLIKIKKIQEKISELQSLLNNNNSDINALDKVIESIEEDMKKLSSQKINNENAEKEHANLEKQLVKFHSSKESLTKHRTILEAASIILKDSGIKTRIIKQYIPVMNKLINKYLAAMDFFVQFELDENFNETIRSRFRDDFSYASFSEGEKMRIDLSLLFTWRAIAKLRNSVSTNLLLMDEVFDSSLDSNGTEEFLKILNDLTSDANIFIISHKSDQLYDKFHSVIRFEKHKNFSRIAK